MKSFKSLTAFGVFALLVGGAAAIAQTVNVPTVTTLSSTDKIPVIVGGQPSVNNTKYITSGNMVTSMRTTGQTANALAASGGASLDPTLGTFFTITPTATENINATAAPVGQIINIEVVTSGVTSYTLTFNTNFLSTGTLATGTVSAKTFIITFVGDGTNFVEVSRTTAM